MRLTRLLQLVIAFHLLLLPTGIVAQSKSIDKDPVMSRLEKAEKYYDTVCREWNNGSKEIAKEYYGKAMSQVKSAWSYANTPEQKKEVEKRKAKLIYPPKSRTGTTTTTFALTKWTVEWDDKIQSIKLVSGGSTFAYKMVQVEGGEYDGKSILDFSIGQTEVTELLWNVIMKNGNSSASQKPMTNVSWDECNQFVEKLIDKTGVIFRLPEDAEWTYAAKGGKKTEGYVYAGSNNLAEVAHIDNRLHPVKEKRPNELGLYDMTGNVCEWTCTPGEYGSGYILKGGSFREAQSEHLQKKCMNVDSSTRQIKEYKDNKFGLRIVKSYE